jgi:hypothetical protein
VISNVSKYNVVASFSEGRTALGVRNAFVAGVLVAGGRRSVDGFVSQSYDMFATLWRQVLALALRACALVCKPAVKVQSFTTYEYHTGKLALAHHHHIILYSLYLSISVVLVRLTLAPSNTHTVLVQNLDYER